MHVQAPARANLSFPRRGLAVYRHATKNHTTVWRAVGVGGEQILNGVSGDAWTVICDWGGGLLFWPCLESLMPQMSIRSACNAAARRESRIGHTRAQVAADTAQREGDEVKKRQMVLP